MWQQMFPPDPIFDTMSLSLCQSFLNVYTWMSHKSLKHLEKANFVFKTNSVSPYMQDILKAQQ